jgi:hypothetical protein
MSKSDKVSSSYINLNLNEIDLTHPILEVITHIVKKLQNSQHFAA